MKSTDGGTENHRKSNADYTMNAKNDDDKNLSEKSNTAGAPAASEASNLFVDNSMKKRDKSPTTNCHSSVDIIITNENNADTSRINTENSIANKKNENQHNGASNAAQTDTNIATKRQQKTICYDFKKGMCRRRFCRVSLRISYRFFYTC